MPARAYGRSNAQGDCTTPKISPLHRKSPLLLLFLLGTWVRPLLKVPLGLGQKLDLLGRAANLLIGALETGDNPVPLPLQQGVAPPINSLRRLTQCALPRAYGVIEPRPLAKKDLAIVLLGAFQPSHRQVDLAPLGNRREKLHMVHHRAQLGGDLRSESMDG